MQKLKDYINFRYNNWLDFSRHMARIHKFDGWGEDLLNDVIENLLKKEPEKLRGMLRRKTKKIVNGKPTTELDKFVLKMLRMQAFSQVGPFRKNTLGQKIIKRLPNNKVLVKHSTTISGEDIIDENYCTDLNDKLDLMHSQNVLRLRRNGFNLTSIKLYRLHFIRGEPFKKMSETEQESINIIRQFLTVTRKTLYD